MIQPSLKMAPVNASFFSHLNISSLPNPLSPLRANDGYANSGLQPHRQGEGQTDPIEKCSTGS